MLSQSLPSPSLFQYAPLTLEAISFENTPPPILLSGEENTLCVFSPLVAEVIRLVGKAIKVSCSAGKRPPTPCLPQQGRQQHAIQKKKMRTNPHLGLSFRLCTPSPAFSLEEQPLESAWLEPQTARAL